MNCENCLELIDDLIEGELDEQTVGHLNWHIFACQNCAARYAELKREKEFYAQYLFNIEPPADLSAKFQARLNSETPRQLIVEKSVVQWKSALFGYFRFTPIFAAAVILIVALLDFSFLKSAPEKTFSENDINSDLRIAETQTPTDKTEEIAKVESPTMNVSPANNFAPKIVAKNFNFNLNKSAKNKSPLIKPKFDSGEKMSARFELSEEDKLKILQLKQLETETVKQIEKTEMLLRSFRNARSDEDGAAFDVAYEREQARKILNKNAQLRRDAENYGTLFTQEMLGKAEPFLLDIANLEKNPAPEKILEIKERVKNQNIIASLQIY